MGSVGSEVVLSSFSATTSTVSGATSTVSATTSTVSSATSTFSAGGESGFFPRSRSRSGLAPLAERSDLPRRVPPDFALESPAATVASACVLSPVVCAGAPAAPPIGEMR